MEHILTVPAAATLSLLALAASYRIGSRLLRNHLVRRLTVLDELPNLGKPRSDGQRIKGTAVICGGSVAGLWTARVCADHFEDVLIVEPEDWLLTDEARKALCDEKGNVIGTTHPRGRIVQYNILHVFQALAVKVARRLFQNFDAEARKANARILDGKYLAYTALGPLARCTKEQFPDGVPPSLYCSRETYERLLRDLVLGSSKRIRQIAGTVLDVQTTLGDPYTLASVVVRTTSGVENIIPAALVVDCSGPSQIGLKWLKRIYAERVRDGTLRPRQGAGIISFDDLRISYDPKQRTRCFRFNVPPEARARLPVPGGYDEMGFPYFYVPRFKVEPTQFMVDRLEGHCVQFTFTGRGGEPLPENSSDLADYLRNFKGGPIPEWIFETLDILLETDSCKINNAKYPNCSWVRYEHSPYIPSNFVAIGDAVMQVNPAYGQGCSKAMIGAVTLDSILRSKPLRRVMGVPAGFGPRFFRTQVRRIEDCWAETKTVDYLYGTTIPAKGEKLSDAYSHAVLLKLIVFLASKDNKVDSTFHLIRQFLVPPTDMFQPSILVKLFFLWLAMKLSSVFTTKRVKR